jgi:hypothetical protein
MINDNPKPNKVDMCGIQKKGIGGDLSDKDFKSMLFIYLIVFVVVVAVMQPRQKNNTHTIDCKTKVAPKI